MTQYAIDAERQVLARISALPAGMTAGDVASVVNLAADNRAALAQGLTILSEALWRAYTDPDASAADELLDSDSDGEAERVQDSDVLGALRSPNLPSGGSMLRSYIPEVEASHQVGRVLHEVGDDALVDIVVAEVEAEISAIEQAELGNFAGRAAQAVLLTRLDASPPQVAAAFDLLKADPFGSRQLSEQVDPHAAAVAAAYWLLCAAEVASDMSGVEVEDVVMEADNIEAVEVATPTVVLGLLSEGEDPYGVVGSLIQAAVQVASGVVSTAILASASSDDLPEEADRSVELSVVDPRRPAPDLLEDLLSGIHAAFLLWNEYADDDGAPDEHAPSEDWKSFAMQKRESFANEVRDVAEANRSLIGLTAG